MDTAGAGAARGASPLAVERDGAVARLVLDRPDGGNRIDLPMARALLDAAVACDGDPSVRCVVLTGRGRLFCAGGDVRGFADAGDGLPALLKQLTATLHAALSRLARMEKPLVTAVNGAAAGAGFSLALLGDVALAARSARFRVAYPALGLTPDGGSTWLLPRLVGLRRAQEILLLDEPIGAEAAAALGLVTRAVDDAALDAEAERVARKLAGSATLALGRTRALLMSSFASGFEEQMEAETRAIALSGRGGEAREGIRAFLDKRRPEFGP